MKIKKIFALVLACCSIGNAYISFSDSPTVTLAADVVFTGKGTEATFPCDYCSDGSISVSGYLGNSDKITIPAKVKTYDVKYIKCISGSNEWNNVKSLNVSKDITFLDQDGNIITSGYAAKIFSEYGITLSVDGNTVTPAEPATEAPTEPVDTFVEYSYSVIDNKIEITGWDRSCTNVVVPEKINGMPVVGIGDSAFEFNKTVTAVKLPNTITYIGTNAFNGCTELTSIKLSGNTVTIGDSAFSGCYSLDNVTIPRKVSKIGNYAFFKCRDLKSFTVKSPDCEISDSSFTICNGLNGSKTFFSGTVYGYEGSTAESFTNKYGYKFEALPESTVNLGDPSGDEKVDASDASLVLMEYSAVSTGKPSTFTSEQREAADVNGDDSIDSSDASLILMFYSSNSTGSTESDMSVWIDSRN